MFNVYPPLLNLKKMDFSSYLNLSCPSTYTIDSISYDSGLLTLTVDYTEDMEARLCDLTLTYDPTIVDRPFSYLSFEAVSSNSKLVISSKLDEYQQFKFIFNILSMITLAIFVLSLPFKMPGV